MLQDLTSCWESQMRIPNQQVGKPIQPYTNIPRNGYIPANTHVSNPQRLYLCLQTGDQRLKYSGSCNSMTTASRCDTGSAGLVRTCVQKTGTSYSWSALPQHPVTMIFGFCTVWHLLYWLTEAECGKRVLESNAPKVKCWLPNGHYLTMSQNKLKC